MWFIITNDLKKNYKRDCIRSSQNTCTDIGITALSAIFRCIQLLYIIIINRHLMHQYPQRSWVAQQNQETNQSHYHKQCTIDRWMKVPRRMGSIKESEMKLYFLLINADKKQILHSWCGNRESLGSTIRLHQRNVKKVING